VSKNKNKEKRALQLGMNPSTASGRLVKDILWDLICKTSQDNCCKCGEAMARDTFSVEQIEPWLDSEDPVGLFFDLSNISFSHLKCNFADARRPTKGTMVCGTVSKYTSRCRCCECRDSWNDYKRKKYTSEDRRNRYLRTGN